MGNATTTMTATIQHNPMGIGPDCVQANSKLCGRRNLQAENSGRTGTVCAVVAAANRADWRNYLENLHVSPFSGAAANIK